MSFRDRAIGLPKRILPLGARAWAVRQQRRFRLQWPRRGNVDFGDFSRLEPISRTFGMDRGLPIDRHYIECFLEAHAEDIRGNALELGDAFYIEKFGRDAVEKIDVLHYVEGNSDATLVADLTQADHIPSNRFDCIVLTQSIQMIYDMKAALHTLHRILKPGGVLLLTSHGISKIARRLGRDDWGEYWRITTQGAQALFSETFPGADVSLTSYGNVLTALCFLHGIAAEELSADDLDYCDPDFEVIVAVRAQKRSEAMTRTLARTE